MNCNLDDLWLMKFGRSDSDCCVVGCIVECKNKMDVFFNSFFLKFQICLLKCFGYKSLVWNCGIKIVDDMVEIFVIFLFNLKVVNVCVWVFKGCEECCYYFLMYIERFRDDLFDEVVGGIEFVEKVMSIEVLKCREFEGYFLKEVDEVFKKGGLNVRFMLEIYVVNERVIDV